MDNLRNNQQLSNTLCSGVYQIPVLTTANSFPNFVAVSQEWYNSIITENIALKAVNELLKRDTDSSDWKHLTDEQRAALDTFREHVIAHIIAEHELFYKQRPELRLAWNFTADAILRERK